MYHFLPSVAFDHARLHSYQGAHARRRILPPLSFMCPLSPNKSFSWAMIDLYLFFRPIILGSVSPLSVPGAHARDRSFPAPGSERNGENIYIFFRICLLPAQFFFTVNISSIHEPSCVLPQASSLPFFSQKDFSPQVMHIQYLHPHTHTLSLLIQAAQNTLMAKLQAKAWGYLFLPHPPAVNKQKKKKNGQKKQRHINVFTCPRVTFESPAVVCFFRTNFKVISEWLRVIVGEPRHDGGWRAGGRRRRAAR